MTRAPTARTAPWLPRRRRIAELCQARAESAGASLATASPIRPTRLCSQWGDSAVAEIVRWTTSARRPSGKFVFERCGTDRSRTVEHAPCLHAILGRTLRADTRAAQTSRELAHVARNMGRSAARTVAASVASHASVPVRRKRGRPHRASVSGAASAARVARCDRARGAGEICRAPRRLSSATTSASGTSWPRHVSRRRAAGSGPRGRLRVGGGRCSTGRAHAERTSARSTPQRAKAPSGP